MSRSKLLFKIILTISLCVMLLVSVVSFAGCKKFSYQFSQSEDQISKIQLAVINCRNEDNVTISVLRDIDDVEMFMSEFTLIEFGWYMPIGDPMTLGDDERVILFTYNNGDYEAINNYAQCHTEDGCFRQNFTKNAWCDKEVFESLFNSWLEK